VKPTVVRILSVALVVIAVVGCAAPMAPAPVTPPPGGLVGTVEYLNFHQTYAIVRFPWGPGIVMMSPRAMADLRPGDEMAFDAELRPVWPLSR
jgi:hypothetical protein